MLALSVFFAYHNKIRTTTTKKTPNIIYLDSLVVNSLIFPVRLLTRQVLNLKL